MAIELVSASVKHERRVRLVFTVALAAGAFASTSYYTVESEDGQAASPSVVAAMVVMSSTNVVELQLGADLVQGALYRISAIGVPGLDASVTPAGSSLLARVGQETRSAALGAPSAIHLFEAILYGIDLRWTGGDFAEDQAGDLATTSGETCVREDLWRRLLSNGLPWDPSYGLKARGDVDGAENAALPLRGRALAQVLEDDRVETATASIDISTPDGPEIEVVPVLLGNRRIAPLRLTVPSK